MRQQQPSGPELTIDEPFELAEDDLVEIQATSDLKWSVPPAAYMAVGPNYTELVDPVWCEEPTLVMSADQSKELLEQVAAQLEEDRLAEHLLAGIHTRPTVRSMQAVVPPSRPAPEVEVVDSQGRRVEAGQWNS